MECSYVTGSPDVKIIYFLKLPHATKTKVFSFNDPFLSFLCTWLWNSYCKKNVASCIAYMYICLFSKGTIHLIIIIMKYFYSSSEQMKNIFLLL